MFILLTVVCAYAYADMRVQPWQHADASAIACLHHHLLAYCGETSKIEQVSMTQYTSHIFQKMLAQCFASNRISLAEIKARHFYNAILQFLCAYAYACARDHDSMPTSLCTRQRIGVKQARLSENKSGWLNILQTSSNKTVHSASQVSESTRLNSDRICSNC